MTAKRCGRDGVGLPRIAAHPHPDAERIPIRVAYVVEDFDVLRPGDLRGADVGNLGRGGFREERKGHDETDDEGDELSHKT